MNINELIELRDKTNALANGVVPGTGEVITDSALNNPQVIRTLYGILNVLNLLIVNNGKLSSSAAKKNPIIVTDEMRNSITISNSPSTITNFIDPLRSFMESNGMKLISTTVFTNWLMEFGYLVNEEYKQGSSVKNRRIPTDKGTKLGITSETRDGMYGQYVVTLYSTEAQKFLKEKLAEIIEFWQK
ncbi:hypothetical protein FWF74_00700 [Candidatus Saccharibacteria bacterium]|nr:hypothetical protein [Candidatus Saccharibacteria bacterium]MCL1963298.1 hypothetical protein [Candidatus Saccharibacteria bacterium]